jgi:hypothetical protein
MIWCLGIGFRVQGQAEATTGAWGRGKSDGFLNFLNPKPEL